MQLGNYSVALERQVSLARWASGPEGRRWVAGRWAYALQGASPDARITWPEDQATQAETYYIAPDICTLLCRASEGVGLWRLDRYPPSTSGFAWLGRPVGLDFELNVEDGSHFGVDLRAISWGATVLAGEHQFGGLLLCYWGTIHSSQTWTSEPLQVAGSDVVPVQALSWRRGMSVDEWGQTYSNGGSTDHWSVSALQLTAAFLAFLEQTLLVAPQERAERHARKRLEREGWTREPLIRVVQLRRRESAHHERDGEAAQVDWACQWVVRGHWRQQYFPSKQAHQPIWITPHVKGPEDKPLKAPRATVFAVTR